MYLPILQLTNLKHLHIDRCRNLKERCAEGSGAEWFQIAHIPNIKINEKYIKGFDDHDDFDDEDYNDPGRSYNYDDSEDDDSDDPDYKYIPFPTLKCHILIF